MDKEKENGMEVKGKKDKEEEEEMIKGREGKES